MQDPIKETAELLRFQQSLLNLAGVSKPKPSQTKAPVSEYTRKLENWVRVVRPKAS